MNIKQKILTFSLLFIASIASYTFAASSPTYAACGTAKTSIINCDAPGGKDAKNNAIWQVLLIALNILTAGVGIAAVGGIVYGSILYASAGDNAGQTKKAIEVIRDVVIGIVAFGLMYLGLNYLIPGGIFS